MDQQSTEDVPRLSAAGAERWTISHGSVGLSVHICPSLLQRSALPEHHCTLSSPKLTLRGLNHMIRFTALITLHIPSQRVYWESELTACWSAYKLRTYALFNWSLTLSQSSPFVHGFRPYSKLKLSCPINSSLEGGLGSRQLFHHRLPIKTKTQLWHCNGKRRSCNRKQWSESVFRMSNSPSLPSRSLSAPPSLAWLHIRL